MPLSTARAKPEWNKTLPYSCLVVHGCEYGFHIACFGLNPLAVDARRGGHIDPLASCDYSVVVNLHEVRLVLARERGSGRPVRFVANDQIEWPHAMLGLGIGDHLN